MANDAVSVPTSDAIHKYGLRSAQDPSSNDGGFLAQVSGNPFFTAVRIPELQEWSFQHADTYSRD